MSATRREPTAPARRRPLRIAAAVLVALVLLALLAGWLLQPPRATGFLLQRAGSAMGLRISASGVAEYRLRGTPQLVLRDVVAQRPGDADALLRAERVLVSLPWSTIRARGGDLTVRRIELDAPVLDLAALQRWRDTREPSAETRIPTLTEGLRVTRGRLVGEGWSVDGIDIQLPSLAPGAPVNARVRGRYLDPPRRVPFELAVALSRPAPTAGFAAIGGITVAADDWSMPAHVRLSGPLRLEQGEIRVLPARFGMSARYLGAASRAAKATEVPFVLGAHGPLRWARGVWSLQPAALALRGEGMVPDASARGGIALGRRLAMRLAGDIKAWPEAWPALPPPLSASTSPLRFALDYAGRADLGDVADLQARRDDTRFDARFRLPHVQEWIDAAAAGSPLPPLRGRLRTPRLEIAGAQLHGVEIEFDDPELARPASP